jgi:hypothetical protein
MGVLRLATDASCRGRGVSAAVPVTHFCKAQEDYHLQMVRTSLTLLLHTVHS